MKKQKRRKRRNYKRKQKNRSLLLVSVFILIILIASYIKRTDIFKDLPANSLNKEPISMGIDISEWQSDIDFKKVRRQGYSYVIIRTGFGWEYEDVHFKEHIEGAKKAGLQVGVYHYSHATTPYQAELEANLVMDIIEDYYLDLPIFYDIESDRQNHLTRDELTEIVQTFVQTLESNGYNPGIYAAESWFRDRIDMNQFEEYPKWIASYTNYLSYEGDYDYWQYTDTGNVNGVRGNCDINIKY